MSELDCPLLRLPPDVILHILTFSQPNDVLRLRQTCNSLKDFSHERALWVYFLRVLIHKARFHPASFPLDNMSSAELEAAATVTLRFLRNFAHDTPASRAQIFNIPGNDKVHSLALVAGDRYLISISGPRVILWDLGFVGSRDSKSGPRMVAHIRSEIPDHLAPWLHVEHKGGELLVRITSNKWHGTWNVMYKINPSQPKPKFEHVATLKTTLFSHYAYCFDPVRMIVLFSNAQHGLPKQQDLWIWDVNANTLSNWTGEPGMIDSIFLLTDFVVLILETGRSRAISFEGQVLSLPKPYAELDLSEMLNQKFYKSPNLFLHTLEWRKDIVHPNDLDMVRTADRWESGDGKKFSFDMIAYYEGHENSRQCTILRRVLQPRMDDPNAAELVTQHQASYEGNMYIPRNVGFMGCDLLYNDLRMISWPDRRAWGESPDIITTRITCHLSSLAGSPTIDSCKTLHDCGPSDGSLEHVFSPRTGRLCFVSGPEGTDITFYDFGVL
ncbi:hypothetical protein DL96DRAFT_1016367 [Flagelloscypha sp. PMI_526]|nr:hypothetical protein DL96DRAFT_1016367 [Flagelloscypha sp. PMI_526]